MAFQEILPPSRKGAVDPGEVRISFGAFGRNKSRQLKIYFGQEVLAQAAIGPDAEVKVEWDLDARKIRISKMERSIGWKLRQTKKTGSSTLWVTRFPENFDPEFFPARKITHEVVTGANVRPFPIILTLPRDILEGA